MAFKAEELMIQVLPGTVIWAACNDPEDGGSGEHSHPPQSCKQDSQIPCDPCGEHTIDISVCQSPSQARCGDGPPPPVPVPCAQVTCQNDTMQTRAGAAGLAGLDLLRHQMRERLSQELPC